MNCTVWVVLFHVINVTDLRSASRMLSTPYGDLAPASEASRSWP
jgi:hypothetical protein